MKKIIFLILVSFSFAYGQVDRASRFYIDGTILKPMLTTWEMQLGNNLILIVPLSCVG